MSNNNTSAGVWVKASERRPGMNLGDKRYICRNPDNHAQVKHLYWNDIPVAWEWLDESPSREPGEGVARTSQLISDDELRLAFDNSNFGNPDKRFIIKEGLQHISEGYETGHTLNCIMSELGLTMPDHHGKKILTIFGEKYLKVANESPALTAPDKAPALREEGEEDAERVSYNHFKQLLRQYVVNFSILLVPGDNVRKLYDAYDRQNFLSIQKLILLAVSSSPAPSVAALREEGEEDEVKEIAYIAWIGAANAHRMYPDNKHTFVDYWDAAKSQFTKFYEVEPFPSPALTAPDKAPALREEGKELPNHGSAKGINDKAWKELVSLAASYSHSREAEGDIEASWAEIFNAYSEGARVGYLAGAAPSVAGKAAGVWVKASEQLPPINVTVVIRDEDGTIYQDNATSWDKNITNYEWLDESPSPSVAGSVEERAVAAAEAYSIEEEDKRDYYEGYLAGAAESEGRFAEWVSEKKWQWSPENKQWLKVYGEIEMTFVFYTTSELYNGPYQEYLKQLNK